MNFELLNGQFDTKDAIDLITQMVQIKVKFHESKINNSINEEDVKFREAKIKHLQQQLYSFVKSIEKKDGKVMLNAMIIV